MPRAIEIAMFLVPFLGFAAWRLFAPSPQPPRWLIGGLAAFAVGMVLALLALRSEDARDAGKPYVPAELRDGRVVAPGADR